MMAFSILRMFAQDVMVNVVPVQQVLPPQALMYIDNPGRYFNVSLTNTSSETQNVYITMNIDCVFPETMSALSTPSNIQPQTPITISPNRTVQLTLVDLKHQFNHLSSKNVSVSGHIMSGYKGGSYGLLPEGNYQITVTAYKWNNPKYASPIAVSSPVGGTAQFTVSYLAKAPQMISPMITTATQGEYAEVDPLNALFSWTESLSLSSNTYVRYSYSLKIVEVLPGQPLDYAIENNPSVYQIRSLLSPMCVIPLNYSVNRFSPSKLYAAQVTAEARTSGKLDYILVENKGKSDIKPFRIVPIHQKTIQPKDTLRDDALMVITDGIYEEEDSSSLSEYDVKIGECLYTALEMEYSTHICDSTAKHRLKELQTSVATMRNMTYAAAKKAGITDDAKNAYKDIQKLMADAEEASDNAALSYKSAYLTLQKLNSNRRKWKESLEGSEAKTLYDECVEAVGKAKIAARNAQVYFSSVQKTEYLAKKEMKYLKK